MQIIDCKWVPAIDKFFTIRSWFFNGKQKQYGYNANLFLLSIYVNFKFFFGTLIKIKRTEQTYNETCRKRGDNYDRKRIRKNYTKSTKLDPWTPIIASTLAASLFERHTWQMDHEMHLSKAWMLSLMILTKFQDVFLISLNQVTVFKMSNFNKKTSVEAHRKAAAIKSPSLIAKISVRCLSQHWFPY